jgi:NADH:ubiquinone oxidoreductase subunit 5 (subunit L)/multisubunit Na+/H+ antiporter MnhA subunit
MILWTALSICPEMEVLAIPTMLIAALGQSDVKRVIAFSARSQFAALGQSDVKRVIAFSARSQFSVMLVWSQLWVRLRCISNNDYCCSNRHENPGLVKHAVCW